jgi:hypothetical protein
MSGSASLREFAISGTISENMEASRMSDRAKPSLVNHRTRLARRSFVRVEVNVSKDDASLVRQVAAALFTLKALSFFGDGNLHRLPRDVQDRLAQAAREVDLDRLPGIGDLVRSFERDFRMKP